MANRLAREKSPYLLQHKDNPVDWYPWGPEAFDKARRDVYLKMYGNICYDTRDQYVNFPWSSERR